MINSWIGFFISTALMLILCWIIEIYNDKNGINKGDDEDG